MQRRVFLGALVAAAPVKALTKDRLKVLLSEIEAAAHEELGDVQVEISWLESDRTPLLIQARRVSG